VSAHVRGPAAQVGVVPAGSTPGGLERGPVGLIGHTERDPLAPVGPILGDQAAGALTEPLYPEESSIVELLESKGVDFTDWEGYHRLEAAEKALGEAEGRERVKIATREAMLAEARAHLTAAANAGS